MLLHGIFPPITTPFYPDGQVYYKKLESNVERYSRTPIAGIVVQGSTGEAILLSDQERRDVFKSAISAAAPNKVMIAGTGIESAIETLRLTEYAALLAFYRMIADQSPLPLIIYNFPQATGYDIPAEVVLQLAEHSNIIAIKESAGNLEKVKAMVDGTRHIKRQAAVTETFDAVTPRMIKAAAADAALKPERESRELVPVAALAGSGAAETSIGDKIPAKPSSTAVTVFGNLKTRQKEVGFQVMVGAAHQLEPSLARGAVGAILAFACPAPTACYEIYAAVKEGDVPLAHEKQDRIKHAAERVIGDIGVPGCKYAMDLNGYYGGTARLPFLPLTGDQKAEIEKLMANIRN